MYRVLSISRNVGLLLTRNDILAMSGFSVISPRTPEDAPFLAAHEQVNAVIIGHSVGGPLRRNLIAELRAVCPNCTICFVFTFPETEGEALADFSIDVTNGPEPLVLALQQRLANLQTKAS